MTTEDEVLVAKVMKEAQRPRHWYHRLTRPCPQSVAATEAMLRAALRAARRDEHRRLCPGCDSYRNGKGCYRGEELSR